MTTNKTFMDKMAEKAEELELQRKAEDLADAVTKFAVAAVSKAGEYAHDNKEKVEGFLDKAAAKVDAETDGKYADKVAKAREAAARGVAKVAERRPTGEAPSAGAPTAEAATAEPATAETATAETATDTSADATESADAWAQAADNSAVGDEHAR